MSTRNQNHSEAETHQTMPKRKLPSPPPPPNSKGKQKISVWELKRKLVEQRLKDLEDTLRINGESVSPDRPMVEYKPKDSVTGDVQGAGASTSVVNRKEDVQPKMSPGYSPLVCFDVSFSTVERAKQLQAKLPSKDPSFWKVMLKSHVSGGFWMGLPRKFCSKNLPEHDVNIVLEDENGEKSTSRYLAIKNGLSGGWRGFAIDHKLVEGDVVVFQLVEKLKFKLYIVRERELIKVNGAIALLNRKSHDEQVEDSLDEMSQTDQIEKLDQAADHANSKYNFDPHAMDDDDIGFMEEPLTFEDVKGIKDFKVQVNGLIIDSEIPKHLKKKYYQLCSSQKMFLHENIISGLNSRLVVGMIFETINVADAVQVVKPDVDPKDLETWDRTLKAFEDLGMVVGFIRARIQKLLNAVYESRAKIQQKREEKRKAEDEMKDLMTQFVNTRRRIEEVEAEISVLEKIGVFEKEFIGAPW